MMEVREGNHIYENFRPEQNKIKISYIFTYFGFVIFRVYGQVFRENTLIHESFN